MKVILSEKEIKEVDKALKNASINSSNVGYQYFEAQIKSNLFSGFFTKIDISVLVHVDGEYEIEYCELVNEEERDSMPIDNSEELEIFN